MEMFEGPIKYYEETVCRFSDNMMMVIIGANYTFKFSERAQVKGIDREFIKEFLELAPGAKMVVQPNKRVVDILPDGELKERRSTKTKTGKI